MPPSPPPPKRLAVKGSAKDFPAFPDGDVAVILSPMRVYTFHASTLRSASRLFAKLLTDETAAQTAAQNKKNQNNPKIKWRVELRPDKKYHHGSLHVRNPTNSRSWGDGDNPEGYADLDAGQIPSDKFHHWENLFRCFYSIPATIRSEAGIQQVLEDVVKMTDVAEYCGSMRVISLAIDSALVRQGAVLWQSIARSPGAWATLGLRTRVEMVVREAVVHLVGQWPRLLKEAAAEVSRLVTDDKSYTPEQAFEIFAVDGAGSKPQTCRSHIASLPAEIRQLCQKKHKILRAVKQDIEKRILSHYPPHLHRNSWGTRIKSELVEDPADPQSSTAAPGNAPAIPNVGRGSRTMRGHGTSTKSNAYGTDIMGWMALSLFRHFVGQALTEDVGCHAADDGGAAFYQAMADAGDSYLDRNATEDFCKMFPLSAKSRAIFEEQLGLLKEAVRPYVADLVRNRLVLDDEAAKAAGIEIKYLTCCIVKHSDMPWVRRSPGGVEEHKPWEGEEVLEEEPDEEPSFDVDFAEPGSTQRAAAGLENAEAIEEHMETQVPIIGKKRRGRPPKEKDPRAPKKAKDGEQAAGELVESIEPQDAVVPLPLPQPHSSPVPLRPSASARADHELRLQKAKSEYGGHSMFFGAGDD